MAAACGKLLHILHAAGQEMKGLHSKGTAVWNALGSKRFLLVSCRSRGRGNRSEVEVEKMVGGRRVMMVRGLHGSQGM